MYMVVFMLYVCVIKHSRCQGLKDQNSHVHSHLLYFLWANLLLIQLALCLSVQRCSRGLACLCSLHFTAYSQFLSVFSQLGRLGGVVRRTAVISEIMTQYI